jgi:hypothetical protein
MWYFRDKVSEKVVVALSADEARELRESGRYIFLRYL